MPKREEIDMAELEMDEMPAEGEGEGEEMAAEGEEMPVEAGPLADVSDEDLMAELKKRGLMSKLEESSPEEMARDEMLGAEEQEDEMSEYA
jgi:hypothetical protein